MKLRLRLLVIMILATICTSVNAFGSNAFDSKSIEEKAIIAYNLDFISNDLHKNTNKKITRREYAETLVNYYREVTGNLGITLDINKFTDIRSLEVALAVELGLIKGETKTTFNPDGFISRKDAAVGLKRLFEISNNNLRPYKGEIKFYDDIDSLTNLEQEAINTLRINEIMFGDSNRSYLPNEDMTADDIVTAILRGYELKKVIDFQVDGKIIRYNQYVELLINDFGEPVRKDTSKRGYDSYLYNPNDMESFFIVYIKDGRVKGIFSNCTSFKYGDIYSDMEYSSIDFSDSSFGSSKSATIKGDLFTIECIFYDYNGNILLDSIYLHENNAVIYNGNLGQSIASGIEGQLFDIINIKRAKDRLKPYNNNLELSRIGKNHSMYMVENDYLGYYTKDGMDINDRLTQGGITFDLAMESVFAIKDDALFIYKSLMESASTRAIMTSNEFTDIGIGSINGNDKNYVTIIVYK